MIKETMYFIIRKQFKISKLMFIVSIFMFIVGIIYSLIAVTVLDITINGVFTLSTIVGLFGLHLLVWYNTYVTNKNLKEVLEVIDNEMG